MIPDSDVYRVLDVAARALMYCFVGGVLLILAWFLLYVALGDWIHSMHSVWFPMSREQFTLILYGGMALVKVLNFMLFLIPWIALRIALRHSRRGSASATRAA